MDAFTPTSDHGIQLAARAQSENAALVEKRKTATATERKNLSGLRGIAEGRSGVPQVNPFKIKVRPGFNARDFEAAEAIEDDAELVASIKAKGVMKALTVRIDPDDGVTLWLVDGERRLRATIRAINEGAPIETVPVSAVPAGMNEADLVASQITHNSGRRYTLLELGDVVRRLIGYGWTHEKIQAETATPVGRQKQALEALELSPDMQDVIRSGAASPKFVKTTIEAAPTRKDGERQVKQAVAAAKETGATRAMPKHLPGPAGKTDRVVIQDAFKGAEIAHDADGSVCVTFSAEAFDALAAKFNLRV